MQDEPVATEQPQQQQQQQQQKEGEEVANTYVIRPNFESKFRPLLAKPVIHEVLVERLTDKAYDKEATSGLCKELTDEIKARLRANGFERYKFVVQVAIGEQRGQGVKMACRCLWDSDSDNYVQDIFMNDSLFCVAVAFGVFHY
ncbi:hypothetical protein BOX15_Mlig022615g1 [Macrostomum lignano]|uniref:Tctex1 domain-containing protein 2 n=1 Tax=Macrostomum lignano TaxID=282301 RepID=A0A267ECN6_9PLAT|nr:hypothetical protein BOX15_Mlig022615g1 [Macrostomum lignano]